MKEYEFGVTFYDCPETFCVNAENFDEAINKAIEEIKKAIKDLPFPVEFDVECVKEPDEDEDEDE